MFFQSRWIVIALVCATASYTWAQQPLGGRPFNNGPVAGNGGQREVGQREQPGANGNQPLGNPLPPIQLGAGMQEPIMPCPFPALEPAHAQFLDQLLAKWEEHSGKVERYRCEFERWEYDPIFGPRDPREAKTYATGKIQYAKPDKGLFMIEQIKAQLPPEKPGEQPKWVDKSATDQEKWVCDGAKIFEFNYPQKQLIERLLPLELQGKSIVDGPLPFFFGAEAGKIKARYWLRLVTPADVQEKEFWLEVVPKYRRDGQNFKMVHVIIDRKEFLLQAMQIFDPAYDPQKNQKRMVFTFNKREVNFSQGLQFFLGDALKPKTPLGWKFVSEPYIPDQALTAIEQGGGARPAATAEKPGPAALKLLPFQKLK
jgi:TIGR03009 family protein